MTEHPPNTHEGPPEQGHRTSRLLRGLMRRMARLTPTDPNGENAIAVHAFRRLAATLDRVRGDRRQPDRTSAVDGVPWPVMPGEYRVGTATSPVAVCALSSNELLDPLVAVPGVAIVGRLYTVNLGIERAIANVIANPSIRILLLCGRDSPVFHTAQGVRALMRDGVNDERRIVGAQGHFPVLSNTSIVAIERFREQLALVDATGETDVAKLADRVAEARALSDALPPLGRPCSSIEPSRPAVLESIPAGGHREPILYDPGGFFVNTIDRAVPEIVCRHHAHDNASGHEIRSRSAERILLGLLRAGLITQMSHAGYLGSELAKAETALRLGLVYEQDKPLRAPG